MTFDDEAIRRSVPRQSASADRRRPRRWLARWPHILLTVLVVTATGFSAGYLFFVYRTDMATNRAVTREVVRAASDGAVALLSYSPDTLGRDLADAKSRIADDYLPYYQQFVDQIVGPSAQRGQITTSASVVKAAMSELHQNSAVVLVFVKQKTASKEKPEPVVTSNSIRVTLIKVESSWLIEKFEGL